MVYATVRNTTGGGHGHQLKDLIGGFTICRLFDFKYYHSVYPYLDFFGVGLDSPTTAEIPEDVDFLRIGGPFWDGANWENMNEKFGWINKKYRESDVCISIENSMRVFPHQTIGWYRDGLISANVFEEVISMVTKNFLKKHAGRKPSFSDENVNVAIHIARGSSYDRKKYPEHFEKSSNVRYIFPLDYFENIMNQIRAQKLSKDLYFHIYTERLNSEEIVDRFSGQKDVVLHIGDNREEGNTSLCQNIFIDFIFSDILVTCNSSFSAMAAYFRDDKITIYHPHSHLFDLPEDRFLATDEDGNFDFHWKFKL